jgi:hypothetical protein
MVTEFLDHLNKFGRSRMILYFGDGFLLQNAILYSVIARRNTKHKPKTRYVLLSVHVLSYFGFQKLEEFLGHLSNCRLNFRENLHDRFVVETQIIFFNRKYTKKKFLFFDCRYGNHLLLSNGSENTFTWRCDSWRNNPLLGETYNNT